MSSYITHSKAIQHNGNTWFINSKGSGIYTHMMKGILDQVEAMLSHHNKVFLLRLEMKQHTYTDNSQRVSKFFQSFKEHIQRRYSLSRFGYVWVREKGDSEQQHYHCFILLDGNKVQQPNYLTKAARKYWELHLGGYLSWTPKRCYYNLKRNDHEAIQAAIYHISYLAKGRGKGYKPAQAKNFGRSRIKKKID
jgi:hypothetical protein